MDTKSVGMEQVGGEEMQVEEGPVLQGFLQFIYRALHSGSFHKTDADEVMEQAETEREEQIAAAFEIVSANEEDRLDEYYVDDEENEIKDYHEQNVDFEDILAEIKDKWGISFSSGTYSRLDVKVAKEPQMVR
ncbi:unnamed protein product [Hymenolepis diminuta]|uniref:DUF2052 domain-containing protein n=1 Tax=Hymenolepis diminuta TaxID=6216 RepID=A0A0R3SHR0_HYMDI|nr:unnamed protein product [Hymenolepis diminuta]